MKKLLLTSLFVLGACGSDTIIKEDTGGDVPTQDPTCDYNEWDLGLTDELLLAQYINSIPVLSEYKICGDITNIVDVTALVLDYDSYLFPIVAEQYDTELVNFSLQIAHSHTPLIEMFMVYDGEEPVKVQHFIGTYGSLQIIDWPILLQGEWQNDLIVRLSAYSFATDLESEYELRFW